MEDLLLLIHRIPYPPNKGDKIRSYNLLKHLALRYRVHLATFVDDPDDWQHVPKVEAMCASSHFAKLNPLMGKIRGVVGLLANESLSLRYYQDAGMRAWVARTMAANPIRRIVVFSSQMAQYAEQYQDARRVVDFCDVDSDKWRQYADNKRWPMSMLYRHEARQLLRYERKVAAEVDASLFVSDPEAELFRQLAPESRDKVGFFNNGVDTDYFSPLRAYDNPYRPGTMALVFTGAMDYWPNVDAVQWFAAEVFPRILASCPDARFYIVGARPCADVAALAALPGVSVTGTVADVRPYIAHAAVSVAPLRVARGIQNKVLEAMAMGRPVVVSPQALEGIAATPGKDLVLADGAAAFTEAVSMLLRQADDSLGPSARAAVETLYSWPSNLARIDARLECT